MRTRMRMITSVAAVALITASTGGAIASASSSGPSAAPSGVKSSASSEPGKTAPRGGCDGSGGSVKKTPPPPGTPDPKLSQTLAGILGISDAQAAQVLERLDRIAAAGNGVLPTDPQFVALADSLHITPQHLLDALRQMKQDIAKTLPDPSGSSSAAEPAPGKS